jgi:hypothetical protein
MKLKGLVYRSFAQRHILRMEAGYTVVDAVDGELQAHDTVTGCLEDHGQVFLKNHRSEETVEVDVLAFHATLESALALLRSS